MQTGILGSSDTSGFIPIHQ